MGSNHRGGVGVGSEFWFPWEKAGAQRVWEVLPQKLLCAYSPFMLHSPNGAKI